MMQRPAALLLCVATVLVSLSGCTGAPDSTAEVAGDPVEEAGTGAGDGTVLVTEDGLPGEAYAELAPDGAWSWFGSPAAERGPEGGGWTVAGFVTSTGQVTLARYDHGAGETVSSVVAEERQPDDRASPALAVREDGRIVVFHSGHRGRWMVTKTSLAAGDVASWGRSRAASGHTAAFAGHTYPNAAILEHEDGRNYVFWRGEKFQPMFARADRGKEWSDPAVLIEGDTEPYFTIASDGDATIHLAFTDGHPMRTPSNSVYYLCYRDGAFHRADGSHVGSMEDLPLTLGDAEIVYDADAEGARSWVWDVAFDELGRPVIAYVAFPSEDDHRYRYARWNGAAWTDGEIAPGGACFPSAERGSKRFDPYLSGGVALDPADPSIVYLSRPVNGVFEIERWTTVDGGASWTSEAVTVASAASNVRPVVPRGAASGGPELLWMNGGYVDHADHATSIRMK
jgi:hypothetical protein